MCLWFYFTLLWLDHLLQDIDMVNHMCLSITSLVLWQSYDGASEAGRNG